MEVGKGVSKLIRQETFCRFSALHCKKIMMSGESLTKLFSLWKSSCFIADLGRVNENFFQLSFTCFYFSASRGKKFHRNFSLFLRFCSYVKVMKYFSSFFRFIPDGVTLLRTSSTRNWPRKKFFLIHQEERN
jgi:hypothetical protein